MTHRESPDRYPGTLGDPAAELGDLRYGALAEFLRLLAAKLAEDAGKGAGRGRYRLAAALRDAAAGVTDGAAAVQAAWEICEPHM
jgi:hypothetical protein